MGATDGGGCEVIRGELRSNNNSWLFGKSVITYLRRVLEHTRIGACGRFSKPANDLHQK